MAVYTLIVPDWRPPSKNELFRKGEKHGRAELQREAAHMIRAYALKADIPEATGPRKVSVRITYPQGRRYHDVDAFFWSVLDSLVTAKMLVSDRAKHASLGRWDYQTGASFETRIRLRDLPDG